MESPANYDILTKVTEIVESYHDELTKQLQKLCFTGIAVIWIFVTPAFSYDFSDDFQKFSIPRELTSALILFVIPIALSMINLIFGMIKEYMFYKRVSKENRATAKFYKRPAIRAIVLVILSTFSAIYGYYILGRYIYITVFS